MALMLLTVIAVLVLTIVTLIAWYSQHTAKDRIVNAHLLVRYVVTLKSGETFDGLLEDVDTHTLRLVRATSMAPDRDPIPVDGSLLLFRSDIAYLQRP